MVLITLRSLDMLSRMRSLTVSRCPDLFTEIMAGIDIDNDDKIDYKVTVPSRFSLFGAYVDMPARHLYCELKLWSESAIVTGCCGIPQFCYHCEYKNVTVEYTAGCKYHSRLFEIAFVVVFNRSFWLPLWI